VIDAASSEAILGVDGIISNTLGLVIGIYVADCCAVYLADPRTGAFGVVHSGKKGSEQGITAHAIEQMRRHYGSNPADLHVQLSPCIRPPAYEIDFAAQIRQQALQAGVPASHVHDTGVCTSSDLRRFYSYRMEKGRTGRMLALLGRPSRSISSMTFHSPAKINLWLRILGKREDGFHEVQTRLCQLALGDVVEIEHLGVGSHVALTCSDPTVPLDESNLAMKALHAFENRTGRHYAWRIHLEKKIPAGAGLGGGSSNAATVLKACNTHTGSPLSQAQLIELGAQIGSDVPCFLLQTPAADGAGRGEQVTPVEFTWKLPLLLIKPPFPIPTPWAYKCWAGSKEIPGAPYAPQLCPWGVMVNDLERPVFEKHLLLPTLKKWLLEQGGVRAALMSGSGSTMFAITETLSQADEIASKAREWCGETSWIQSTTTAG
jgi:4-diphosphocytidyl-2-C-methyl-D-erythritol kinase